MNRREKLIRNVLGKNIDQEKVKMLDTTVRFILGDMGKEYFKFWQVEGPGVMCFQPDSDRVMFYLTLEEIHSAQEKSENNNDGDLAETFRRILEAAQKINPEEKAGYIINDSEGIRYFEVDYEKEKK
jgi:hypothetical protein